MTAVALAWAWLVTNWRPVAAASLAAAVLGVCGYVVHLRHAVHAEKAVVQQAVRQAVIQQVATQAVDHVAVTTQAVEEHTRVVVREIQASAGSDTPVPAAVLSGWRDGLSDGQTAAP